MRHAQIAYTASMIFLLLACATPAADSSPIKAADTADDTASDCVSITGYHDADGDGWGTGDARDGCEGDNLAANGGDCNDADRDIHPEANENVNELDDDCDGTIDEDTVATDDDGDGVTEMEGDCDDTNPDAYPGAPEVCGDGIDTDCDGVDATCLR